MGAKKEQRLGGGHPGPLSEGRVNRFFGKRIQLTSSTTLGVIVIGYQENTENPSKFRDNLLIARTIAEIAGSRKYYCQNWQPRDHGCRFGICTKVEADHRRTYKFG